MESDWAVSVTLKWNELFTHFLEDDFNLSEKSNLSYAGSTRNNTNEYEDLDSSFEAEEVLTESRTAWQKLVETLNKIKQQRQ